ncbi:MAG: AraC family transcriptional regulator [Flavobacteriia bacterium]|nr:MAG: AraC family transcriptional regulator [Flavobacteriia bacterium]
MEKYQDFKKGKTIVLPKGILNELEKNELTSSLMVTDIGYFEKAHNHYRERKQGCKQNILIYCTDGEGWFEVDQKRQHLQKNQYVIISSGTPHKYGSSNHNPWSIYWIHFTGSKSHLFINHPNEKIGIDLASNARFADRIILFEEIFNNLEMQYSIENIEYANICLWHMLGSFRYLSQFRKITEYNQKDKIDQSIRYMRDHMSEKISLEQIAKSVGLSVSQFSLLFKKKTSRTPIDYLLHLRIRQASRLLDFSSMRINEISNQVGFSDPFYFSRMFTRIMGISPKAYRNQKKG